MAYDDKMLYLAWQVRNAGPLKNTGDDFQRVFKTGGAVDVKLGTDPDAPPKRMRPVAGDLRLVVTVHNEQPAAVFYRPVAPGAPAKDAWKTTTVAGGTTGLGSKVTVVPGGSPLALSTTSSLKPLTWLSCSW